MNRANITRHGFDYLFVVGMAVGSGCFRTSLEWDPADRRGFAFEAEGPGLAR